MLSIVHTVMGMEVQYRLQGAPASQVAANRHPSHAGGRGRSRHKSQYDS
jgi:hypothetical protein